VGADAGQVLAPEFQRVVPVADFLSRTLDLSRVFSPLVIVGVDASEHMARARFPQPLTRGCSAQPAAPARIWCRLSGLQRRLPAGVVSASPAAGSPAHSRLSALSTDDDDG